LTKSREIFHNGENRVEGWILDLYPANKGEMVIWIKTRGGECFRLADKWHPTLYVSGKKEDLAKLMRNPIVSEFTLNYDFVEKLEGLQSPKRSTVIKITGLDARSLRSLARKVFELGGCEKYRLYNVDIPSAQMYLYERDLFPLAYVDASVGKGMVSWSLRDSGE